MNLMCAALAACIGLVVCAMPADARAVAHHHRHHHRQVTPWLHAGTAPGHGAGGKPAALAAPHPDVLPRAAVRCVLPFDPGTSPPKAVWIVEERWSAWKQAVR